MNKLNDQSQLLSLTLGAVYPFIIVIGIYVILNGHASPGGGFHGGAILSTVYTIKYLMSPEEDYMITKFQRLEKIILLFIILIPITFIYMGLQNIVPIAKPIYLTGLDILIGVKVACGLSILFFRFVFYETR